MYACYYGHLNLVKMMIEVFNVDPERKDIIYKTGFIFAC